MASPLRKRYIRDLKQDFGKYIVIFLFMAMLICVVSGYLVAADSIETTFYEGFEKYNVEDGHIIFSQEPEEALLKEIEEKGKLKFYDLTYVEEDIEGDGATIRTFVDRTDVNLECLMKGEMPKAENEIALDRVFAETKNYKIGDSILLNGKEFKLSGLVALVDYGTIFENESDMMFSASTFGVGVVSKDGYDYLDSKHISYCYAWKYNEAPADETEEKNRSEELLDILEDVIKAYDTKIVQAEVDALYDQADALSEALEDEFEKASSKIEEKITDAYEKLGARVQTELDVTIQMQLYMSGAAPESYLKELAKQRNTSLDGLVAEELGTTEEALLALTNAMEDFDKNETSMVDSMVDNKERPVVNLDDVEDGAYENDMDFSTADIHDLVDKIDATGLYNVAELNRILDEIDALSDYEFNEDKLVTVDGYVIRCESKAINYCMDDMGSDKPMFLIFAYIVIALLAFVFAVTTTNTIEKEAGVIGTLRASGYTRGELLRHYLFMPIVISVLAAIVGNILGYTVMVESYKGIFFKSFSLATYKSIFNNEAFLATTVLPFVIMVVINCAVLSSKLKISPMKFLRHDLNKKKKRRAMLLNKKIPFIQRFRLRVLFQNLSAYATLVVGIMLGGTIAVFGWMFGPLLKDYAELIKESQFAKYQYVLMEQVETDSSDAEKYCITALNSTVEGFLTDEISVYGIMEDSAYISKKIPANEVFVSNGIAAKFKLSPGDTILLEDGIDKTKYEFKIADVYQYDAGLAVFMNRDEFNKTFGENADYFSGYFSNSEIQDIEKDKIATVITEKDLIKVADQMLYSVGSFMNAFKYFGVVMFLLMMYLMTKQIIEKNMQSIAMTKILGFRDKEIAGLYLVITSIVVLVGLFISIPFIDGILRLVFEKYLYKEITGYIPYIISGDCYVKEVIVGILCYIFICIFMMRKIGNISKSEALKNVE